MKRPIRGEVWLIDLGLAAKVRPGLVMSIPLQDEDRALLTTVTHTTSPQDTRFEIAFKTRFLKPGVFDVQNVISVPRAKFIRRLGVLSAPQFTTVEHLLRSWLGL